VHRRTSRTSPKARLGRGRRVRLPISMPTTRSPSTNTLGFGGRVGVNAFSFLALRSGYRRVPRRTVPAIGRCTCGSSTTCRPRAAPRCSRGSGSCGIPTPARTKRRTVASAAGRCRQKFGKILRSGRRARDFMPGAANKSLLVRLHGNWGFWSRRQRVVESIAAEGSTRQLAAQHAAPYCFSGLFIAALAQPVPAPANPS